MCQKGTDGIANSVDPDQTAPESTMLAQTCLKTYDHYGIFFPWRGWGGYSCMKVVYMCRRRFQNGGIRKWPLTENGGLLEQFFTEKKKQGTLEIKITKKTT